MSNDLVTLEHQFAPLTDRFTQVLAVPGVSLTAPRLIRSVLVSVERNPRLMQCTRQSLFNAAMSAACLGLECDGVTGQAFLIPFEVRGTPTAQLVIGYKGYNTMAARSGITITGEVVRVGDKFEFDEGASTVSHVKLLGKPDRRMIAVWAKGAANDRPPVVKVLDIDEILAVKKKSPGAKKSDSPWNDEAIGFPAMAEKTAKRRLARAMPLNVMQWGARLDEAFEEQGAVAHISPDYGVIVDAAPDAAPAPTAATLVEPAPQLDLGGGSYSQISPTDELTVYDRQLGEAAAKGLFALEQTWKLVPYKFQVNLKSALERRHKPRAREADAQHKS